MGTIQTRTADEVERQYAALVDRLEAADGHARVEELTGQHAVLAWILHRTVEAPLTLDTAKPTPEMIEREFIAAGRATLDQRSPAYPYASGAYAALRWLAGLADELAAVQAPPSH